MNRAVLIKGILTDVALPSPSTTSAALVAGWTLLYRKRRTKQAVR